MTGLAQQSGGWILVERRGHVLGHAPGTQVCPEAAVQSLLQRTISPLRDAVGWKRGAETRGALDGLPVRVVRLSAQTHAWMIGGAEVPDLLMLRDVLPVELPAVHDHVIAALLEPSASANLAQAMKLVVLSSDEPDYLARDLSAALVGGRARLHQCDERVLIALDLDASLGPVLRLLRPGRVTGIGVASVPAGAPDWSTTFRLAVAACDLSRRCHLPIADVSDPVVAAQLVLSAAAEAAVSLADDLHYPPLARLREHDARNGGLLLASLDAWCRHGRDVRATAAAMFVHVNTLRYRLRRAAEVAGVDLTCPTQMLALQVLAHNNHSSDSRTSSVRSSAAGRHIRA